MYLEYFGLFSTGAESNFPQNYVDGGITYLLNNNVQFDVRAGSAVMYFPEANVLVPRRADPQSKTPAFKSVLVTIEAGVLGEAEGRRRRLAVVG